MSSGCHKLRTFFSNKADNFLSRSNYIRFVTRDVTFSSMRLLDSRTELSSDKIWNVRDDARTKTFHCMFSSSVAAIPNNEVRMDSSEIVTNMSNSLNKMSGPRTMPTRHSRHHYPPVAPLSDLQQLTDEFLAADPGSLFAYDPSKNLSLSKMEQYEEGLKVSDAWRRKVEFILRGYSALFPKSIVDVTTDDSVDEYTLENISPSKTENENMEDHKNHSTEMIYKFKHSHIPDEKMQPELYMSYVKKRSEIIESSQVRQEVISSMQKVLERLEVEANVYVSMWAKHKSNRMEFAAVAATKKSSSESQQSDLADETNNKLESTTSEPTNEEGAMISDELTSDETIAWGLQTLTKSYGAPPGPSIHMYDLILDIIAVGIQLGVDHPVSMIQSAKELQSRAIDRYILDVNSKMDSYNIIPTNPTTVTFNAVIRATAVAKYDIKDTLLRDVAIDVAFTTYDLMYRQMISDATLSLGFQSPKRNSATYLYMLKTVNKYFPISPTRGNIVHSLFIKAAVEEGVLDEIIFDTLLYTISPPNVSHSLNFDTWVAGIRERYSKFKYCYGFPSKWSSNKRSRRYNKKIALY